VEEAVKSRFAELAQFADDVDLAGLFWCAFRRTDREIIRAAFAAGQRSFGKFAPAPPPNAGNEKRRID
jgi:hypothetical protein